MATSRTRGSRSAAGPEALSRRERQIMDVVYERGRVTVAEVLELLPDPPSYSSVRALMAVLEKKGQLRHEVDGNRYLYIPVRDRRHVRKQALEHVVKTFFEGSAAKAAAALLGGSRGDLTTDELEQLAKLIEKARKEGR